MTIITEINVDTIKSVKNENEVLIPRGIGFPKFWIELSETHRICGDRFVDGYNDPVNVWKRKK